MRTRHSYTDHLLRPLISQSSSWAEVIRALNRQPSGGLQRHLKTCAARYGISFQHFTGRANSGGKTEKRPLQDYLCLNGPDITTTKLRKRLIREEVKEARCEDCGCTHWLGDEAPLELHHCNGNHRDNRLENLRILCANCHAVTERTSRMGNEVTTTVMCA